GHGDVLGQDEILRPARVADGVLARLQEDGLAIGTVDLGVEEEVGGQATALRRIDAALVIAEGERGHRRLAVHVADAQLDEDSRRALEEIDDLVTSSDPLLGWGGKLLVSVAPEAEAEAPFPAAGIAAVNLEDAILQLQAGE